MKHCLLLAAAICGVTLAADPVPRGNIAFAAKFQTRPDAHGDFRKAVIDGNPGTASSFAVGTGGNGVITASFAAPRTLYGFRFFQPGDIYWTSAYRIEGDADGDGRFELLLAERTEAAPQRWFEERWDGVVLAGLRFVSVDGVSKGRRAHPTVGEFEIIGDVTAADIARASAAGVVLDRLPAVSAPHEQVVLNETGRPLLILCEPALRDTPPARALLQALDAAGVEHRAVADLETVMASSGHVLCIGTMVTNPLIERLYWNRYTFADAVTPGAGRFLLHAVFDPTPLGKGRHAIVVGCSDAAGLDAAVPVFAAALRDGALPAGVLCGPEESLSQEQRKRLAATPVKPTFCEFTAYANHYLRSGATDAAAKAIEAMTVMAAMYAPGGERHVPVGSSTHRKMPWPEETSSWEILCAWDAFEETPGIEPDLRLAFTNALLQFTRDLVPHVSGYSSIGKDDLVTWNHTTFPLLGIHFGARYFQRHYGLADMQPMLDKAAACFLAQSRSWKPQEDADSYLTLTTEHARIYCLAEDHMDYFRNGLMATYADYVVGFCDTRGYAAGFGDSHVSTLPNLPEKTLPLALWATGNGEYRWLMDQFSGGSWADPYGSTAAPVEPTRLLGVTVFPLDPQVYEWAQNYPTYNEPLVKADVRPGEAFDKISFRENWTEDAQYLLLDGFARGKHLHYDGNAIIAFVEGTERWLLDCDYLVRNTTEHAMTTIMRDGRADALVPSMSALVSAVDLPRVGYTHTVTRDYAGCDWDRHVVWLRGEWFVVRDVITARQPGTYDTEITWKTIDEAGNQTVDSNGCFTAARGLGSLRTTDCQTIEDPEADNGTALLLDTSTSRVAFGVDLPPGVYSLDVIARGVDGSSDSLWISVDGADNQPFHLPKGAYGAAAGDHKLETGTPAVTLADTSRHSVAVTLRERPPVRIDRFVFRAADGSETVFDATDLPPPPPPRAETLRSLHIDPVEPVDAWVTNHRRQGITVPVSILHQRDHADLAAGDRRQVTSLVYVDRAARRRRLSVEQADNGLVAVQGTAPALVSFGALDQPLVRADVQIAVLTSDALSFGGLRSLEIPGLSVRTSAPLDVEIALRTGRARLVAHQDTTVEATGNPAKLATAGSHELDMCDPRDLGMLRDWVTRRLASPAKPETTGDGPAAVRESAAVWTAFGKGAGIETVKTADLRDGQGTRLFVCRGAELHCLSMEGRPLWSFSASSTARDVAFGDLRENEGLEVLLGSSDTFLYILGADGTLLDKHQMAGIPWARSFGERPFPVFNVAVGDITGDAIPEILTVLGNYDLQAHSADWELLWRYDHAKHGSTQLSLEDTDLDGEPDTILLGDHYGSSVAVAFDGRAVYRRYTSIGDVACMIADIDADGRADVVTGSSTGDLTATPFESQRERIWSFHNYGFPVNALAAADVTEDGANETLVASGTGYLYAVDRAGKAAWQTRLGYGVNAVVTYAGRDGLTLACADESGRIHLLDRHGTVTRSWQFVSPPRTLLTLAADEGNLLIASLADGRLVALDPAAP